MNKFSIISIILFFICTACSTPKKEKADFLIINATIIDVGSGSESPGKFIVISGDTIRAVGDMNNREDYEGARIIDAGNKFVMPGLWDMHVHFRGGDSLITENKNLLPLFLAHGVTTVRDAGGDITPAVLDWREQIKKGELDGPAI